MGSSPSRSPTDFPEIRSTNGEHGSIVANAALSRQSKNAKFCLYLYYTTPNSMGELVSDLAKFCRGIKIKHTT